MPTITFDSNNPIVVLPLEEYESLIETLELLSDPDFSQDVEDARKAYREGRTVSWVEVKKSIESEA